MLEASFWSCRQMLEQFNKL